MIKKKSASAAAAALSIILIPAGRKFQRRGELRARVH